MFFVLLAFAEFICQYNSAPTNSKRASGSPILISSVGSADGLFINSYAITSIETEFYQGQVILQLKSKCSESTLWMNAKSPNANFRHPASIYINNRLGGHFVMQGDVFRQKPVEFKSLIHGTLCVSTPYLQNSIFAKFFLGRRKILSIAFERFDSDQFKEWGHPEYGTGSITFGDRSYKPIKKETTTKFNLQQQLHQGWASSEPVQLKAGSVSVNAPVMFDIGTQFTLLPLELYNAVIGNLSRLVYHPLDGAGINEVHDLINTYLDEPMDRIYFKCSDAALLSPLDFNGLMIPVDWLYEKVRADKATCRLRVMSNSGIVLGFHLMKRFFISVNFESEVQPFIELSHFDKSHSIDVCLSGPCCAIC